jgi:REP element-mobilizing transposase RayT
MKLSTMARSYSPRRGHQYSFFEPICKFFGGALLRGKRKSQRPLSFKHSIHIVLKSSKARGKWAFMDSRNKRKIDRWLAKFAKANGLRVYKIAVNWNHIHLCVRFPNRASYKCFIRSITGTLPRSVFGFEHPTESFWDDRPFSRIVDWGRDYRGVMAYLELNILEANGLTSKNRSRKDPYERWLARHGAFGARGSHSSA